MPTEQPCKDDPLEILLEVAIVRSPKDRTSDEPVIQLDEGLMRQCPSWMKPIIRRVERLNESLRSSPSTGEHGGWNALQRILNAMEETGASVRIVLLQPTCPSSIARIAIRAGTIHEHGAGHPVELALEQPLAEESPSCLERFRDKIGTFNDTLHAANGDGITGRGRRELEFLLRYLRQKQGGYLYLTSVPGGPAQKSQ
ncbi:MAG: hypothetical protein PHW10_05505 [Candidatus Peribacteraceae bacterium]|nr:hypothetical protein [Candidatus Peribacteraceae bacterium]